eukprot:TRINITY_DN1844_c4_g1_i1.p1 TRINITY_DN1844_c4_g1~~TRINITY_DN1844_c4_g1_i1.p1  ORF type:complete len:320 (-),score=73.87 TRINITY_DN1844_c4_g1_i1:144-1103(-)
MEINCLQRYKDSYFISGFYIILWFIPNVTTVILNKYIFRDLEFIFPLSLTFIHMFICFIGAFLCLRVFKFFNYNPIPFFEEVIPHILPLSALFCLNIVLGNISLRWVPVSFMQTVKSLVPAFTFLLQITYFRDSSNRNFTIYLTLIPIVGGVAIASYTEVNFNVIGFVAALIASLITALQAVVSGKLLKQQLDPINLIFYMAPFSAIMLLPFVYYKEYDDIITNWKYRDDIYSHLTLIISGIVALLLNITQFLVIQKTSALTATVSGNLKVVLSITLSVLIFKNQITFINGFGCAIAILGVFWYNKMKYEQHTQNKSQH